jgi:F-type H+-transporting ATPase subunit b
VRVIVTPSGPGLDTVTVLLAEEEEGTSTEESGTEEEATAPNPILPVTWELIWGAGTFIVLALLMRYWLYPRLQKGTDARSETIKDGLESAEHTRASVRQLQTDYEVGIAAARAEAATVVDAARAELEADRRQKLEAATARISARKAEAAAADDASRQAALSGVEDAVADVAAVLAGRALGRTVDPAELRPVAADVVSGGAR